MCVDSIRYPIHIQPKQIKINQGRHDISLPYTAIFLSSHLDIPSPKTISASPHQRSLTAIYKHTHHDYDRDPIIPIAISSVGGSNFSGPKLMGSSCSTVIVVHRPSRSYIMTGMCGSQNSRMNCLHMPQGDAGGEMSVATARARMSPLRTPLGVVVLV